MRFFEKLPEELRQLAWRIKADELAEAWAESWRNEEGETLPSFVEEDLLYILDNTPSGGTFTQQAQAFYEDGN